DLVLGIAPALLALARPDVPLVPVDAAPDDVANGPIVNSLQTLDVAGLVPALSAGDDRQPLGLGLFVGGQHLADAGPVDGDRLLGKELLARLDRRLDVEGPEPGRRGQHHQVAAVDHLLVGVEADEGSVVGNVELLLANWSGPDALSAILEVILENVAHRVELDVVAGPRDLADVLGCSGAPAAATDQSDLDGVAAGGVGIA